MDFHTAKALLEWQVDMGADEAILDAPVNRYEIPEPSPRKAAAAAAAGRPAQAPRPAAAPPVRPIEPEVDPVAEARVAARGARSLEELEAALAAFPHCDLKRGARSLVFADGQPRARVMIVGEAPGREEDREGRPFVGRAGQLLDRMFDAIGLGRAAPDAEAGLYITNVLPWRPPQNRDPSPQEIDMLRPFVEKHIELVGPDLLVLMGNHACMALLKRSGISRMRGRWHEFRGVPAMPMFHPAYLLRNPGFKREAWQDLLAVKAKLLEGAKAP
ncbi:Uracil DNA glycosylase superfamily protein [Pseudoruegeria aquimaris]|uniref:Type-4 uracil-DNA glycosylase n=1 Tax=Pseudoruegeria aquimaris TaxID=393663 RepID=A0A1Y5TFW8_9RHOB|nr:uracil-DNA glycosylase [Pseudoruegeria aquimaris]SLN62929.1 Uracil DNA glycosylase superfamily protein [Pseudoruegeria aquimaris]